MKEHPILFSGPMVRAILEGRKTQTRRLVVPQFDPEEMVQECCEIIKPEGWQGSGHSGLWAHEGDYEMNPRRSPYGKPGDHLWVRETFAEPFHRSSDPDCETPVYVAGNEDICLIRQAYFVAHKKQLRFTPSIHMPRRYSRITLEVTEVRVQRLQEISEGDAKAEGLHQDSSGLWTWGDYPSGSNNPVYAFQLLWDSICTAYPWASNPWVWAYTFERVK